MRFFKSGVLGLALLGLLGASSVAWAGYSRVYLDNRSVFTHLVHTGDALPDARLSNKTHKVEETIIHYFQTLKLGPDSPLIFHWFNTVTDNEVEATHKLSLTDVIVKYYNTTSPSESYGDPSSVRIGLFLETRESLNHGWDYAGRYYATVDLRSGPMSGRLSPLKLEDVLEKLFNKALLKVPRAQTFPLCQEYLDEALGKTRDDDGESF